MAPRPIRSSFRTAHMAARQQFALATKTNLISQANSERLRLTGAFMAGDAQLMRH